MAKTEKQKPVNVMRSIKMPFNDAEGAQMGHQIAFISQEIDAIKEEAKSQADSFKQQITAKETQMKSFVRSMNLGFQMVQKSCEFKKNFETQKREYWFDGKLVDEEPLTAHDHQLELEEAEKSEMAGGKNEADTSASTDDSSTSATGDLKDETQTNDDLEPIPLTEELITQRDEFIKLGDQAMKKKKYQDAHTYYKAAEKIDSSNTVIVKKVEGTENFLKLLKNAEEVQKGGGKGKEETPIHNENNPLESPEALKEYAQAIMAGDAAVKAKKYQEAEIQFVKAYNLKQTDELNAKLEEVKVKVDRLIEANVIAPREEWPK
jgi:tetratricopeptide (TPR) repeat protein